MDGVTKGQQAHSRKPDAAGELSESKDTGAVGFGRTTTTAEQRHSQPSMSGEGASGLSIMARSVTPEVSEDNQPQASTSDFPPNSGARPKKISAKQKKREKKRKKQAEKTATTSSVQPSALPVQDDVPERGVITPERSDPQRSLPLKGLTQKIIRAGSYELQTFQAEIKQLYQQISKQNWKQLNRIQSNLRKFLPELERLCEDYELFTRNYPASSSTKRSMEKNKVFGAVVYTIFTHGQRSEAALLLGRISQCMMEYIEQFLLQSEQNSRFLDQLQEPLLKTACLWLRWIIESRINDQQAIDDKSGQGLLLGEDLASINPGQRLSLQSRHSTPRCSEAIMNMAFYHAISWLVSGDVFYQKHRGAGQQKKPEHLANTQRLLTQLLKQYQDYRPFKDYEPQPRIGNLFEVQMNYAEQLIFCVHTQRWDLAHMTLQRLSSMAEALESSISEFRQSADYAVYKEQQRQQCTSLRPYALHDYLSISLQAGHQFFNHFYQQHVSASTQKEYSLNIEQLRSLLTGFQRWANRMIQEGLVTTPEQTVEHSYLESQQQLEENTRQFEQLHQDNLKFLAQYFQEQFATPLPKKRDRKKREGTQPDSRSTRTGGGTSNASSEVSKPALAQAPARGATSLPVIIEQNESGEESSDEESGWQQVRSRKWQIPAETALKNISEALGNQNAEDAISALRTTDLHNALQQLRTTSLAPEALPVDILIPLVSGYLQICDMSRHVNQGESLIPDIRPFVISLLDEDALTSMDITNQFIRAVEEFNREDMEAQKALSAIAETINTLLDLQTEDQTSSHITIMTACDVLITSTDKLKEKLVSLREGIINAWKRRYELLLRHYPERIKAKKDRSKETDKPLKALLTNNTTFKKCSDDFEKCQGSHQEKQKSIPSSPSLVKTPARPDIGGVLKSLNLSLEQVPSLMAELSHRIEPIADIIRNIPENEDTNILTLICIAHHLDIEMSIIDVESDITQEITRGSDRQPTQRQPLANYLVHPPRPYSENERIRALRHYFHLKIPDVLANLNADATGMPVVLTGSTAFQLQILSLWDHPTNSALSQLYEQPAQSLPTGITHDHMQACMTPRDTDLIILNHNQFNHTVERINASLQQARLEHWELENADGAVITRGSEETTYLGKACTTDRITVTGTEPFPNNIHYVVDATAGLYPDYPSPDHYTTTDYGNSHIHIRRMDDIILDELGVIQTKWAGGERIQKAITRLFMIACLESQQPRLDSVSRMALLHALDLLPGDDPVITALAEQLRQRHFYIICHEGRSQGARQVEPENTRPEIQ